VIDNTGTVKDSIAYDAFGNIKSGETDSSYRGWYAWTGRQRDNQTGLQYNNARWYDSTTGCWMTQDPMGFDAGDSNLYRYVNNEPANTNDPSGLQQAQLSNPVLVLMPDGSVRQVNVPAGKDPVAFVRGLYPNGVIHGVDDAKMKKNGQLKRLEPFMPQPPPPPIGGADITPVLEDGLGKLEEAYKDLTKVQKIDLAKSLWTLPTGLYSWDISGLIGDNPAKLKITKGGEEKNTATVKGAVYYTDQINYILWGKINRLLADDGIPITYTVAKAPAEGVIKVSKSITLERTLSKIKDYRNVITAGGILGDIDGRVAWAKAGWTGNWNDATSAKIKNVLPNTRVYNGLLSFAVGRAGFWSAYFSKDDLRGAIDVIGQTVRK
jgi:RHS repeat-associated protein